ncbi:MAG: glutathione S-transferase family protein [Alphaproteobacteria bacterium]|jgi:glutathione S-transferase|nr:glutathione S-transferase family protein [Alphaproteobacteria bacterium]
MKLIGRNHSPYVRRVAVALQLAGVPYDQEFWGLFSDADLIRTVSPMRRVPALVLDDGAVLVDSGAILDYLADVHGPGAIGLPATGPDRRAVTQVVAWALACVDKMIAAAQEKGNRPPELIQHDLVGRIEAQAQVGFAELERRLGGDWFVGGGLTQADATVAIMVSFAGFFAPGLIAPGRYPRLQGLVERVEALPAFQATFPR